jgi:hypothetical protein
MANYTLSPSPFQKFFLADGVTPAANGRVYTFLAGLTTPATTYQNSSGTPNANPIHLDGSGQCSIFLAPGSYSYAVYAAPLIAGLDTSGGLIETQDNISSVSANLTPGINGVIQARVTLVSGTAVPTTDVTAATTLYFTPFRGNSVELYDGTTWAEYPLTELSIPVPAVASQMYDLFAYPGAGVINLELLAWTSDSARATGLVLQDGLLAKSGATTRRYVASVRTTTVAGQVEDSLTKRFVWNYYNRQRRGLRKVITTGYTYAVNTIRQANADATNQVEIVTGIAEDVLQLAIDQGITPGAGTVIAVFGFGLDSTTTFDTTNGILSSNKATGTGTSFQDRATWQGIPAIGYHKFCWNEIETQASGATFASQQYTGQAAGINGFIMG